MALYQINNIYPYLKQPNKYIAENKTITTRSGWEISFCIDFLDKHTSVLEWTSESIIIPYQCPVRNYSTHRYFPDFWMKVKEANGNIKEYLIEIKPESEFNQPKVPSRKTKSYIDKVHTYIKNQAKWNAAKEYCKKLRLSGINIEFIVMTEKGIHYENGKFDNVCFFKT